MRAREFTINVPINIKINGDGDPEIEMPNQFDGRDHLQDKEVASNFIPPLQQQIELQKHENGKEATVIDQIKADDDTEPEMDVQQDFGRLAETYIKIKNSLT